MISVTKTFLPPRSEYNEYLKKIWTNGWITNNGEMLCLLEKRLRSRLGVKNIALVNNGTAAILISLKALNIGGEVITTPFSYVASTSSLVWGDVEPIFADIDPNTLCIDPDCITKKITSKTSAILATHVYGIPCNIKIISKIAREHNLRVIYDAAHAFGVKYNGQSILDYGDISILSLHATKVFHTVEGGAIITKSQNDYNKVLYMRNFGHKGPEDYWGVGINGKLSELHAAMGLCVLPHLPKVIRKYKKIAHEYDRLLNVSQIKHVRFDPATKPNYMYYPVIFNSEKLLLKVKNNLSSEGIFPRRYFYPSLNKLPYVNKDKCPVSEGISTRILCLPVYYDLSMRQVHKVSNVILQSLKE